MSFEPTAQFFMIMKKR